jgi:L-lactate dehydrogenase
MSIAHTPAIKHVAIIGVGMVGATIAYTTMLKGLAAKITIVDINQERAEGEVMDISHGLWDSNTGSIVSGDYLDCRHADIVVIAAGASQKPGQSRLDLTAQNTHVLREVIKGLGDLQPDCKVIVVSNPVDVLTTVARREISLPTNQVFGSGTYLDTLRLRYALSAKLDLHPTNLHTYVLGEHGDSSFVNWESSTVGGRKILDLLSRSELTQLEQTTRTAAYEIIHKKGSSYYGISVAVCDIIASIFQDKHQLIPISTMPGEDYGINHVCMGIPAVIGKKGIEQIWKLDLSASEQQLLNRSAEKINQSFLTVK